MSIKFFYDKSIIVENSFMPEDDQFSKYINFCNNRSLLSTVGQFAKSNADNTICMNILDLDYESFYRSYERRVYDLTKLFIEEQYNKKVVNRGSVGYMVYPPGSYKDIHDDNSATGYSAIFSLSSFYSGGHLVFPDLKLDIKLRTNSLIVFPSKYHHCVKEVEAGIKISQTTFWELKE